MSVEDLICPVCGDGPFTVLRGYKMHVDCHEQHECPHCGRPCKGKSGLSKHVTSTHSPKAQAAAAERARAKEAAAAERARAKKAAAAERARAKEAAVHARARAKEAAAAERAKARQAGERRADFYIAQLHKLIPDAAEAMVDRIRKATLDNAPAGSFLVIGRTEGPWFCHRVSVGQVCLAAGEPVVVLEVSLLAREL